MAPFEFIILFFSFIYTLGLTHLLFAVSRMIRHRRKLVFSWPHALWMLVAASWLSGNWLSLWDFRHFETLTLSTIASGMAFVIINYFVCSLVSPDFEDGESYDMQRFHAQEGRTYVGTFLLLVVVSTVINFLATAQLSIANWGAQNALVIFMLPAPLLALFVRKSWVQVLAPLLLLVLFVIFTINYYPVLAAG